MRSSTHQLHRFIVAPEVAVDGAVPASGETTPAAPADSGGASAPTAGNEGASEEKPDTQEVWDQARALDKIRKANAEAKALRDRAKAAEEKASGAEDLARERDELARKVLRLETAAEFGLDPKVAARLQGETAEEMRQDAEALLELFAPRTPPSQTPRATATASGPRQDTGRVESSDEAAQRMFAARH